MTVLSASGQLLPSWMRPEANHGKHDRTGPQGHGWGRHSRRCAPGRGDVYHDGSAAGLRGVPGHTPGRPKAVGVAAGFGAVDRSGWRTSAPTGRPRAAGLCRMCRAPPRARLRASRFLRLPIDEIVSDCVEHGSRVGQSLYGVVLHRLPDVGRIASSNRPVRQPGQIRLDVSHSPGPGQQPTKLVKVMRARKRPALQ